MRRFAPIAATGLLLLLAACGNDQSKDGVSAQERRDLDNAAAMVEGNQMFDTSADSLVLEGEDEVAPPANDAAPSGNMVGLVDPAAPTNQAGQR